jgi:Na+/H+-dicarboxylate symporter
MMQNYGIEITPLQMIIWVFISTIAAIGEAGIPMGCYFISVSLMLTMDVPISLMGVILPLYNLMDAEETMLNVWSDCCVTMVVDKELKTE